MFLKLFRHEMKACARYEVPVLCGILCMGVVAGLNMMIVTYAAQDGVSGRMLVTGTVAGMVGLIITAVMAAIAVTVLTVLLYLRFYKTMVTDEAYLTFTLPVSMDALLISKLLSAMLWTLIGGVVCVLAVVLALAMQYLAAPQVWISGSNLPEIFAETRKILQMLCQGNPLAMVFAALLAVMQCAQGFLLIYLAILIGSCLARKYKLLASVGAAMVLHFVVNGILSVISMLGFMDVGLIEFSHNSMDARLETAGYLGMQLALSAVVCVIFYLLCRWLGTKKVNLD